LLIVGDDEPTDDGGTDTDGDGVDVPSQRVPLVRRDRTDTSWTTDGSVPTISIGDMEIPLFGPFWSGSWALFNLIMTIIGIAFAVMTGLRMYSKWKRHEDEFDPESIDYDSLEDEERKRKEENRKKRRLIYLLASVGTAVVAAIVFIITQDMRLPMVFVDIWTLLHIVLLVVGIAASVLAARRLRNDDDEEPDDLVDILGIMDKDGRFIKDGADNVALT
jgi:heme/copper-type cytochrome/quinol oxidase subunit 2